MRIATNSLRQVSSKRSLWIVAAFLLSTIYISFQAFAHRNGNNIGDVTNNGSGQGCSCHNSSSSSNTTVTITPPTGVSTFTAGTTYTFQVTVSNSGESAAGVEVSATNGSLAPSSTDLQSQSGGYLSHNGPKTLTSGSASWSFTFTPSSSGSATIYATGNAVNNDFSNTTADQWNHASNYTMTVQAANSNTKGIGIGRTTVNLGNVRVGSRKADSLKVTSTGNSTVTISSTSMNIGGSFSRYPTTTSRTLTSGSAEIDSIIFSPSSRGLVTDSFIVNSDATTASNQRVAVYVSGQGIQGILGGAQTLAFATQRLNTPKSLYYVITNTGDDTLFLNTPTISGSGFSILQQPTRLNLGPNQKDSVRIQFTASAKQTYSGSLSLTAGGGVTGQTVTLSGQGVAPVINVPAQNSIGGVRVNQQTQGAFIIGNTGDDTLHVSNIAVTGGATARFSILNFQAFAIKPGGQQTVLVSYTPNSTNTDSATVTVTSDDISTPTKTLIVFGNGLLPRMSLNSFDTVDFGAVKVGTPATQTVRINNLGSDALTLTNVIASPEVFSVIDKPYSVQASGSGFITIQFKPTTTGTVTGMAIVIGDDPSNQSDTVYFKGNGTNSALSIPSNLSFNDIPVGSSKDSSVTFSNAGSAAVQILGYKLKGADAAAFHLTDTTAHTVAANGTAKIHVSFLPTNSAVYSASVDVITDDNSAPIRTITISGRGVKGQLLLNAGDNGTGTVDLGTIDTGKSVTHFVTIKNTGTAQATITSTKMTGSPAYKLVNPFTSMPVAPGDSVSLIIQFSPVNDIQQNATLTITPAEGAAFTVNFRGVGKVQAAPNDAVRPSASIGGLQLGLLPNPSRDHASVIVDAKQSVVAHVAIYDMTGKEIAVLTDGMMNAGTHTMRVAVNALPSGEYFVRVIAQGMVAAERRMIVQH